MCDKRLCGCAKKAMASPSKVAASLEEAFAKFEQTPSNSLLKKHLTRELFDEIKLKQTSYGSSLMDVIQSGLKHPDSGVGIYACDPEAYEVFKQLFDPIIEDYHGGFAATDAHPAMDFGDPSTLGNLDPESKFVISTRVRCGRSLEGYPFNPTMTKAHYIEIQDKVRTALGTLEGELKGTYYPLEGMDKDTQQMLIDDHFLFKEGDRFLQDANACRYWPTAKESSESTESTDKKDDVDTVLVLPSLNAFGNRPIQPIFGEPDLDDDSFEGLASPAYFNPFRTNPFDGFVASMQSMMNRLREQMATMLSTRIGQGASFFPWSGKIPEGANTTSTTKIIDGHVVTINETTFSDGTDDSQTVFRVRTIDVKPEVQTTSPENDSESVTGTPTNDKEETTVPPRSVESVEDNDNEIPKNQVDTLTA